jgi:hypothetical protein
MHATDKHSVHRGDQSLICHPINIIYTLGSRRCLALRYALLTPPGTLTVSKYTGFEEHPVSIPSPHLDKPIIQKESDSQSLDLDNAIIT